jgi:hypothetical protein
MEASGQAVPVPDPRLETAGFYKASVVKDFSCVVSTVIGPAVVGLSPPVVVAASCFMPVIAPFPLPVVASVPVPVVLPRLPIPLEVHVPNPFMLPYRVTETGRQFAQHMGHSGAFDIAPRPIVASRTIPMATVGPIPVAVIKEDVHPDIGSKINVGARYGHHRRWLVDDNRRRCSNDDLRHGHTDPNAHAYLGRALWCVAYQRNEQDPCKSGDYCPCPHSTILLSIRHRDYSCLMLPSASMGHRVFRF